MVQARRLGGFGGFVRTPPWQAEVRKLMLKSANNGAAHWACYNDNHGLPACHLIPQFRSSARLLMQPQTLSRKISLSNSKKGALWTSEIRQKAPRVRALLLPTKLCESAAEYTLRSTARLRSTKPKTELTCG